MQTLKGKIRGWLQVTGYTLIPLYPYGHRRAQAGTGRLRVTSYRRGFTLIELLVVIAIISVLAGMLMPALGTARHRAREAKARAMIASLQMALSMYDTDYGVYPQSATTGGTQQNGNSYAPDPEETLVAMLESVTGGGPYMEFKEDDIIESSNRRVLLDPWGRAYVYVNRYYYNAGGDLRSINTTSRGPFHPFNDSPLTNPELDKNTYNIYSLGADGETNGGVTHTGSNWNNSNLYNDLEDGYKDNVDSTDPRYDDINSWE